MMTHRLAPVHTPHAVEGRYQFLVIGGGVIGSALVAKLAQRGSTALLEPKLDHGLQASQNNAGAGRRLHWDEPTLSLINHTLNYLKTLGAAVGYREAGYLWLHTEGAFAKAKLHARSIADRYHVTMNPLEGLAEIQTVCPEITSLVGMPKEYAEEELLMGEAVGAIYSPNDCLFDPNLVVKHYRQVAETGGAKVLEGFYVTGVEPAGESGYQTVYGRRVDPKPAVDGGTRLEQLMGASPREVAADLSYGEETFALSAERVIWTNGAWATWLYPHEQDLPSNLVWPQRRQNVTMVGPTPQRFRGLLVLDNGVYLHPEGDVSGENCIWVMGNAHGQEPKKFAFGYEGRSFFEKHILWYLAHRMEGFQPGALTYRGGYSGLYPQTRDGNSILDINFAGGSGGHGVMAAWGLADLYDQAYVLEDPQALLVAKQFSGERFTTGELLSSGLHI